MRIYRNASRDHLFKYTNGEIVPQGVCAVEKPFNYICQMAMNTALLSLGSNLGDRRNTLASALARMDEVAGKVVTYSGIYESEPWGFEASSRFLNQVVKLRTELAPLNLLHTVLSIENELGRVRGTSERWCSRTIDIDILFYNDLVMYEPRLTIPHPAISQRRFTLMPLTEIAPGHVHPVLGKMNSELLQECTDNLLVELCP